MNRKRIIRYSISDNFKSILRCVKKGYTATARVYMDELSGMVRYMRLAGDISEEIASKITHLQHLLRKKYWIY